jgi:hypothetical protein
MTRVISIIFFLLICSFAEAQTKESEKKDSNKKESTSIQQDTTQQKIIVFISYEIGEDSLAHNIKYLPRPNLPAPTDQMIEEAKRVISKMKVPPRRDSAGNIINTPIISRIAFTPNKDVE